MSLALARDDLPRSRQGARGPAVSSFVKGGGALLLTALVDLAIAFWTPYWATWTSDMRGKHGGYGLWQTWQCPGNDLPPEQQHHTAEGCEVKWTDSSFPLWYIATEACISVGLIGLASSLIMLLLYIFWPRCHKNKVMMDAVIGTSYTGGICTLIGLCVFCWRVLDAIPDSGSDWFLSWSFSLACTSFVLNSISASILVTESKRLHQKEYLRQKAEAQLVTSGYFRLSQPGEVGELRPEQQTWGQFVGLPKIHGYNHG